MAEAIVRQPARAKPASSGPLAAVVSRSSASRIDNNENDEPGNAFAVRPPPAPPYVPPALVADSKPTAQVVPAPVIAIASIEPPLPPVPYQVIGTWDDGREPGVFLSSSSGTLLARPGAVLQAEYKVIAITKQQISLLHLASKREVHLAVPRPTGSLPAYVPRLNR
ncbi:MAG: hypothetical protein ABI702_11490 [Burkholderiales bacterium]